MEIVEVEPAYKLVQMTNAQKMLEIKNWFDQKTESARNKGNLSVEFNFNDVTKGTTKENSIITYTINQVNYDKSQSENISLGVYESEGKFINAFIIKITKINSNEKEIQYYDSDGNELSFIRVNELTKEIKILSRDASNNRTAADCGQATMDCIDSMYTKQGWGSVFLTITSIIEPWTVAIVAAACATSECTK
jgi:hypothetical protein